MRKRGAAEPEVSVDDGAEQRGEEAPDREQRDVEELVGKGEEEQREGPEQPND